MKCLLVDDSPSMLELMEYHLRKSQLQHLEIIRARNGAEAIDLFRSEKPDVMLLDYVMPDMTGVEVLNALGGQNQALPVVMISSFNDVEAIVQAVQCGAQNYLLKDRLSPGSLNLVIQDAMRKYHLHQKLRFKTAELERFTHMVAHDLKDQISGVYGVLNYLVENPESMSETQVSMVQTGCESARKMHEFVVDLLSYALAAHSDAKFEQLSLQEMLENAKRNLAEQLDTVGAFIHQPAALPEVIGSRRMLMQVFQNLLSNAIKYRSSRTPEITIQAEDEDIQWKITLSDNGKGIAKEHLEAVFQAFEQPDLNVIEGIGVGLATCRRIIEDVHQGKIWVKSSRGQGATFCFTLPKNLPLGA